MADTKKNDASDQPDETTEVPKGQEGTQATDLNKIEEHNHQQESNVAIDSSALKVAMSNLTARLQEQKKQQKEKKEQLAKVSIKREDVDLLINEFDLTRDKADTILRENDGDVTKVMEILINEP